MSASTTATAEVSEPVAPVRRNLRLLVVSAAPPSFVYLGLQLDRAGYFEPSIECVDSTTAALAQLRGEACDGVIIELPASLEAAATTITYQDTLDFLVALRSAGHGEAVLVLADWLPEQHWSPMLAADAEIFPLARPWDSSALLPMIERAIRSAEHRHHAFRLSAALEQRLSLEREEAGEMLEQQRSMISQLSSWDGDPSPAEAGSRPRPLQEVDGFYRDLLRTYVIMGSGSLSNEVCRLAEALAAGNATPCDALQLHVRHVEQLVRGLGRRSARHVLARADLLILEVQMRLSDCYQQRRTD